MTFMNEMGDQCSWNLPDHVIVGYWGVIIVPGSHPTQRIGWRQPVIIVHCLLKKERKRKWKENMCSAYSTDNCKTKKAVMARPVAVT